jgi:hypothetical protein
MWVQWLKSDEMPKKLVKRSKKKHQFLMYLIRKVGDRQKGMGLRITKFQAISHMSQDILHFGVPLFPGNYAIIESSKLVKGKRGEVYSEISYLAELEVERIVER